MRYENYQYNSPFMGMGNNPVLLVDSSGGTAEEGSSQTMLANMMQEYIDDVSIVDNYDWYKTFEEDDNGGSGGWKYVWITDYSGDLSEYGYIRIGGNEALVVAGNPNYEFYSSITEFKESLAGSAGGDDGLTMSETSKMATAMGSYFEVKNRLIKWGLQGSSDWGKAFTKYTKFSNSAGRFLGYYSATVYGISATQDFQSGNNMNGIGNIINAGMSIYMTKGGALGLYSGSIYFLINETIGWQEMGRRQYQIMQNNQYWWRNYAH